MTAPRHRRPAGDAAAEIAAQVGCGSAEIVRLIQTPDIGSWGPVCSGTDELNYMFNVVALHTAEN